LSITIRSSIPLARLELIKYENVLLTAVLGVTSTIIAKILGFAEFYATY
jgi:hypothetical protein